MKAYENALSERRGHGDVSPIAQRPTETTNGGKTADVAVVAKPNAKARAVVLEAARDGEQKRQQQRRGTQEHKKSEAAAVQERAEGVARR